MDWESLRDGLGAATTLGGLDAGTHLAPETVRRLCCDGSVIPVVLGSNGEVLDWGLEQRFFTDAQTKRLWLRDGGCTYPGCDAPPQWADAHHLVHWADLGPSDLDNAASREYDLSSLARRLRRPEATETPDLVSQKGQGPRTGRD